jgi:hypothetical protein
MSTNANLTNPANDFLAQEAALFGFHSRANGANAEGAANSRGNQNDRPAPQLYLNVGLEFEVTDPETGETRIEEVYFYKGLPIDTMDKAPIKAKDTPNWINQQVRTNLIQELMTKKGMKLPPGGTTGKMRLIGFLQRVKGSAEPIKATDQAALAAISASFGE